jgi:hypothetical protein
MKNGESPKRRLIEEYESRASHEAATDRKHPLLTSAEVSGGLPQPFS